MDVVGVGYCGVTTLGGDCERGVSGAWEVAASSMQANCMRKCLSCARCNFISFSAKAKDCS